MRNMIEVVKNRDAKICVVGLGYMGLPLACLLAKAGFKVTGFDVNKQRVESVNKAQSPFLEEGLPELLKSVVEKGSLVAKDEISESDIFLISVPTPLKGKKADLDYVIKATESIKQVISEQNLIIIESTIPPGCSRNIVKDILDKTGKQYYLAHCPERAIPGRTLLELVNNDRVIGGIDEYSTDITEKIYLSFVKGKIHLSNIETAEVVKLFENTSRDINIALANSFHLICDSIGIDSKEAINLANKHPRVNILSPGHGVGGHCIPIDPWFLVRGNEYFFNLIKDSREINDRMPEYILKKIESELGPKKGAKITLLGMTYKPNVDDMRESPSLRVAELAKEKGYVVRCHDPFAVNMEGIETNFEKSIENAELVVILTPHDYYRSKDFSGVSVLDVFGTLKNSS